MPPKKAEPAGKAVKVTDIDLTTYIIGRSKRSNPQERVPVQDRDGGEA
jgi:hypothetical protein